MRRAFSLAVLAIMVLWVSVASAVIFQAPPETWPCGPDARSVAVGDVNGDGAPDLIAVNTAYGAYSVLLNDGDGTFGMAQTFQAFVAGDEEPRDVQLGDFDGVDGLDMVIPCTGDWDSGWTQVFFNTGLGFDHHQTIGGGDGPWHCLVGQFDAFTGQDIVVSYPWSGSLGTLHNDGGGWFNVTISPVTSHPIQLDKADLDLDGDLDIVFTQHESPNDYGFCYALNDGNGYFSLAPMAAVGAPTGGIAAGDFNGDGRVDAAVGLNTTAGSNNLRVYFGQASGGFSAPALYGNLPGALGVVAADFDGDTDLDLAVCAFNDDYVTILHNTGAGLFTPRELHATAAGPYRLRAADVDGDGLMDLAVACLEAGVVQVFRHIDLTAVDEAAAPAAGILGVRPNPFNPNGEIRYGIAREGRVRLSVYDTRGRLVRSLRDGWEPAGERAATWNGLDEAGVPAASGVYLIELVGPDVREARKATLLK
jgi:hypothetical protein